MIAALIFILICLIIMGYITYRIIEEDKKIYHTRKDNKKTKKGKK